MKIRSPIVVAIFGLITLGIYVVFWWYYVNREMADYGRSRGTVSSATAPAKSTLALFPGALIIVPALWTTVTTFQRIQAAQRMTGKTPINGWLGLVLYLVIVPAFWGYIQSGLDAAWKAAVEGLSRHRPDPPAREAGCPQPDRAGRSCGTPRHRPTAATSR